MALTGLPAPSRAPVSVLLDGRHRLKACQELGIEPATREYTGNDPAGFVVSLNLHRRHLDEGQRGMVVGRIARLPKGRPLNTAIAVFIPTQAQAAEMLNVSIDTGQRARVILEHGVPELVAGPGFGGPWCGRHLRTRKVPPGGDVLGTRRRA